MGNKHLPWKRDRDPYFHELTTYPGQGQNVPSARGPEPRAPERSWNTGPMHILVAACNKRGLWVTDNGDGTYNVRKRHEQGETTFTSFRNAIDWIDAQPIKT